MLFDFCVLNMDIHIYHSKIMSHVFEHWWYWIRVNIIYINYNMEFIFFCINLWKLDFTKKNYEPMKLGKFVMWLFYSVVGWCFFTLLMDVPSCCSWLFDHVASCSSITLLVIPPWMFGWCFFMWCSIALLIAPLCYLLFFCVAWSLFHCVICCFALLHYLIVALLFW
jgi:hypothetical protein